MTHSFKKRVQDAQLPPTYEYCFSYLVFIKSCFFSFNKQDYVKLCEVDQDSIYNFNIKGENFYKKHAEKKKDTF